LKPIRLKGNQVDQKNGRLGFFEEKGDICTFQELQVSLDLQCNNKFNTKADVFGYHALRDNGDDYSIF